VVLDGVSIGGLSPRRRVRAGLTRSFQSLELFGDLTIRENLAVACDPGRTVRYAVDLVHPGEIDLDEAAQAVVADLDLTSVLDRKPGEISYGRRRIVAIARAVAAQPSVLMLDEPAAGLDENETADLARLIRRLADERKMGVLLVEHDVNLVMSTCDRIVVIDFGRVIASGTPSEIGSDRAVRDAYLGHADEVEEVST
jgi:ABC-type branched-subunit amino acid transport system ATPase component